MVSPSHLLWQQMDYIKPLREFAGKIHHVHAKDAVMDVVAACDRLGVLLLVMLLIQVLLL